jgi:hypothetical protein
MTLKTYKIDKKQTLLDACIQVYGTAQLLYKFAKDNSLNIDSLVNIGDSLIYDDTLGDEDLKFKIAGNNNIINNPGVIYEPETINLIARMDVKPSSSRVALINDTIKSLKDFGIWDKLSVICFYNAHDQQAANLNWIGANYTTIPVNSPVWVKNEGYSGDELTSYLDTQFIPSVDSKFSLNNASFGYYLFSNPTQATTPAYGCIDSVSGFNARCQLNPLLNNSGITGGINAGPSTFLTPVSSGLFCADRDSFSQYYFYYQGVKVSTPLINSVKAPDRSIFLLALNQGFASFFGNDTASEFHAGESLSVAENLNLYNIIENYNNNL